MRHHAPRPLESAPHYRAARDGRLDLPYCDRCGRHRWPATAACAECGGELGWRPCAGTGRLLAHSVVRRAVDPALQGAVPYVVAVVELDEGPRLFTNLVDVGLDALHAGLRVRCRFEPTDDPELAVAVFGPL